MRRRYVQINGELIEVTDDYRPRTESKSPMVMGDIQPYQSMVDGSMIGGRAQHREHLRQHGLTEVGNETKYLKPRTPDAPPGLKQTLIEAMRNTRRNK
jgi:hypothetical protein